MRANPRPTIPWQRLQWPPDGVKTLKAFHIPPIDPADALPDGITIGFRPAWHASAEQIDTFAAVPTGYDPQLDSVREVRLSRGADRLTVQLDCALLFVALEHLVRSLDGGRRVSLVVPVHAATLATPHAELLHAVLRYFPDAARARCLFVELIDCPSRPDNDFVAAVRRLARGPCRDVLLRVGAQGPDVETLHTLAPHAIGAASNAVDGGALVRLARRAAVARTYARGIGDERGLREALEAGHWLLMGDAVRPLTSALHRPASLPRAMLLKGMQAARYTTGNDDADLQGGQYGSSRSGG